MGQVNTAYTETFPYYKENIMMAETYTGWILDKIKQRHLKRVVSLGIGFGVFCDRASKIIEDYTLIEDDPELVKKYPFAKKMLFEDYKTTDISAVEMCFVLEHVKDPVGLLDHYASMMIHGGRIFVVVPNTKSVHKQIGVELNILDGYEKLTDGDNAFFHVRTYDYDSILNVVSEAGLRVKDIRGLYLKPFPTKTMETFDEKILKAFVKIGEKHPRIANAIYMELT